MDVEIPAPDFRKNPGRSLVGVINTNRFKRLDGLSARRECKAVRDRFTIGNNSLERRFIKQLLYVNGGVKTCQRAA